MRSEFTGRHMAACLVGGFGIVMAVNFTMAAYATESFSGVVVQNSYVASQHFNSWLDKAEGQRALGWQVAASRDETGKLQAITHGVPSTALVSAELRRPLGDLEASTQVLTLHANDLYLSKATIPDGRWIVRLTVSVDGKEMQVEERIE